MKGFNTGDGYMGLDCEKKSLATLFLCELYKNIRRITVSR